MLVAMRLNAITQGKLVMCGDVPEQFAANIEDILSAHKSIGLCGVIEPKTREPQLARHRSPNRLK
jgi:hypothetical protein